MEMRSRRAFMPAMRALEASGDGYWEADLSDGSAWFSPWFYERLGWPVQTSRTSFGALKTTLPPHSWEALLTHMRLHLEQGTPLDLEVRVQLPGGESRWWRFRGKAQRNDIRHPVRLAGSMRDVTEELSSRIEATHIDALLRAMEPALITAIGGGAQLRLDLAANDAQVHIDAARLRHTLCNALLVARAETQRAAEVTLSTRPARGGDAAPHPAGDSVLVEILETLPGAAMRLWIPTSAPARAKE